MPIVDIFSKRKRRALQRGQTEQRPVQLPQAFRTQVAHIWLDSIGRWTPQEPYAFPGDSVPPPNQRWIRIARTVARERGVFSLSGNQATAIEQCLHFLMNAEVDGALDVIEVSFQVLDRELRGKTDWERQQHEVIQPAEEAIAELNARFAEREIPYRFPGGQVVSIDSDLLHRETTEPAIELLHDAGFTEPLSEFMTAEKRRRQRDYDGAIVAALNAYESTLKSICQERGWPYSGSATATDLVKLVVRNRLVPAELSGAFENLLKSLEVGLPSLRHNYGGHGAGPDPRRVAVHLADYALHLAAANIVLLIRAHRAN